MSQSFDYLIVGQGLAGSLLAHKLIEKGANIAIIDNPNGASSSKVAAGIFNPVTGKRFVKTWLCDDIYPKIIPFYQSLELKFGSKFLHLIPIVRPISNNKEQNIVIDLCDDHQNEPYIEYLPSPTEISKTIQSKLGVLSTKVGGWLDVNIFLDSIKSYLFIRSNYIESQFDYTKLEIKKDYVIYNNCVFKKIIFCEGYSTVNNPFFDWLPFNAVKGEVLNLKMDLPLKNFILLKGIFIVPTGNENYKVGATYNWSDKLPETTDEARIELEEKLNKIINVKYEVLSQKAGIRPATIDRRPFLGLHPKHETIGIFNGLGTKGVSLGPYLANEFSNFLLNSEQLNEDININRFSSLYLSSDFRN
ncbi:MAG: FAD-dependent oxidoreductase [Bacteroidota bacterium]